MPTYSRTERLQAIQAAGFNDPLTALSVSLAEFGENRDINVQSQSDVVSNGIREPSFGPWQLHLPSHPDVTQSCAMDLTCSTKKAFDISNGGTDFSAWSAFNNGSYSRFMDEVKSMLPDPPPVDGGGPVGPVGPVGPTGPVPTPKPKSDLPGGQRSTGPSRLEEGVGNLATAAGSAAAGGGLVNVNVGVPGFEGVGSFFSNLGKAFRPENLWRAAFVVIGVGAVFLGGRMYFAEGSREEVRGG